MVEGKNLVIEWRWADGNLERLSQFAREFLELKVDLIVAPQTDSALTARRATETIPILFLFAEDPVEDGLVTSLARPGGNITGLTYTPSLETFAKQLELLKEIVPKASRVAVLWNPARYYTTRKRILSRLQEAAESLGVELQVREARGPEDFEAAFDSMVQSRAEALLVVTDSAFFIHRRRIAELEARHRLPGMHATRERAEAGSLIAYGPNLADSFRRGAVYLDKILKGARPADLPVEQPTKFELVINLKTAKALGITIPHSILLRADRLIE